MKPTSRNVRNPDPDVRCYVTLVTGGLGRPPGLAMVGSDLGRQVRTNAVAMSDWCGLPTARCVSAYPSEAPACCM